MDKNPPKQHEVEAVVLRPFGPNILKTTFPPALVEAMNTRCDTAIEEKEKGAKWLDASMDLVGHVKQEIKCDVNKVPDLGQALFQTANALYTNFMENSQQKYLIPNKLEVHDAWFVRSFAADYNPLHIHTVGNFSCIAYLQVPESISDKNSKHTHEKHVTEGWTEFSYGSTAMCCAGSFKIQPKVGDFYMFPTYLFHNVYPFFGEGERRSFSANVTLHVNPTHKPTKDMPAQPVPPPVTQPQPQPEPEQPWRRGC